MKGWFVPDVGVDSSASLYFIGGQVRVYQEEEHELLPGQFFSDEPGLYIEGEFGIRLETVLRWVLNFIETNFYIC